MQDASPAAPPRWIPYVTVILGLIAAALAVSQVISTLGGWRVSVDLQITDLQKRMDKAEENQKTYIPVLIGLSKDVTFLADRARREDERRDRAATH